MKLSLNVSARIGVLLGFGLLSAPITAQAEPCPMHMSNAAHVDSAIGHSYHQLNNPASIMGDHVHGQGAWMLSYRPMRMVMEGSRDGTNTLSPLEISGDYANTTGMGPSTLRVVPTKMVMDMHMLSAMFAPTDRLTVMLMGSYVRKTMDAITYAMMNADQELGRFSATTQGWSDTKIAALYDVRPQAPYKVIAKLGISLPTGSIDETATMLMPSGVYQTNRAGYGMQLGSGTYDLEPALTYSHGKGAYNWGAQYKAVLHTGRNREGYTRGDLHSLSVWGGYQINSALGTTLRIGAEHESQIDGRDDQIAGASQMMNPLYYGGRRIEAGLGFNITPKALKGQKIAVELIAPLYQNLNGPQMERDYSVALRYSVSF